MWAKLEMKRFSLWYTLGSYTLSGLQSQERADQAKVDTIIAIFLSALCRCCTPFVPDCARQCSSPVDSETMTS